MRHASQQLYTAGKTDTITSVNHRTFSRFEFFNDSLRCFFQLLFREKTHIWCHSLIADQLFRVNVRALNIQRDIDPRGAHAARSRLRISTFKHIADLFFALHHNRILHKVCQCRNYIHFLIA